MFMLIGPVTVDAFITETHTLTSETTDYPREVGPNVSDHTRAKPRTFECEGVVSDAPLGEDLIALRQRETGGTQAPSEFAYAQLEKIHESGEPVTVVTSLRTYTNMVMESCTVSRDKDTGMILGFQCQFKKIDIVENQRTVIRTDLRGAKSVNRGFKAPTPVYTQAVTFANGNTDTRTVYYDPKDKLNKYKYADGSVYKNEGGENPQKLEKLKRQGKVQTLELDKNKAHTILPLGSQP